MTNALLYKRGKGHRPTHPDRRPKSVVAHALFAAIVSSTVTLPTETHNRAFCCAIMDQGQTGTCEAHTEAEAVYTSLRIKGKDLGWIPSPATIYQGANGLQRAAYNPGVPIEQLPALSDDGLEPVFATQFVEKFGVRPTAAPTPDGRNSDCTPANAVAEVDPAALIESSKKVERGTASVDFPPGATRIDALCSLLASGKLVKVALYAAYDEFETYGPGSPPLGAPLSNPGSDHAVLLVDYRTNAAGKKEFLIQNHWSEDWGEAGWAWCSEEFVNTWTDMEVADIDLAEAA